MAKRCEWGVEFLSRGEWLNYGCFRSEKAARKYALERQAENQRDVSIVRRRANGGQTIWMRDHRKRQWRKVGYR